MKIINTELSTKMVGKTVIHKTLGKGEVTLCTNTAIGLKFPDKERFFSFPYAFKEGFLSVEDPALQQEIIDFYDSGAWTAPIHDHCEE